MQSGLLQAAAATQTAPVHLAAAIASSHLAHHSELLRDSKAQYCMPSELLLLQGIVCALSAAFGLLLPALQPPA
jgi:hypothetical protein